MSNASRQPIVLLLNDQAVESLALTEALQERGYYVAGPLRTTADALVWIEQERPDLAILGVMPADGSGEVIAEVLRERTIPFLVYSTDKPDGRVTGSPGVPWLAKPAWPWDVAATLDDLSVKTLSQ